MRPTMLTLFGLLVALAVPSSHAENQNQIRDATSPVKLTDQALQIHREALLIDGHNDLPYELRKRADGIVGKLDIRKPQPALHTDIPRLRKGGMGAQFWSAYVPAETARSKTAVKKTLEQIDL